MRRYIGIAIIIIGIIAKIWIGQGPEPSPTATVVVINIQVVR